MRKENLGIRITARSRETLEQLKEETALSYGWIIDLLLEQERQRLLLEAQKKLGKPLMELEVEKLSLKQLINLSNGVK